MKLLLLLSGNELLAETLLPSSENPLWSVCLESGIMAALLLVVLLTTLVSLFCSASTTSILLPLYVYPGDSLVNWTPLFNALSAHPSVQFTIIVNPDSGPGAGTYPDSNYVAGISKLHSYQNTLLIGYVHTLYTQAPLATLESNITKYANWASYTGGTNISVQGIFFDEVTNDDSSASLQYIASAAAFTRSAISGAYVVYNPGSSTSAAYFSPVPPNLSVQFENVPSQWRGNATVAGFAPGQVARSAVVLHDEPGASGAQSIVRQSVAAGVGAVYAAPDCCYADLSYVDAVASVLDS